jgi:hypothetical protein
MTHLDRTGKSRQIGTVAQRHSRLILKILIFFFAVRVHSRRALRFICTALSSPAVHAGPEKPRHSGPAPISVKP